jgi:hypothetical protein
MHLLTGLTAEPGVLQPLPLRMRLTMPDEVNDVLVFNVTDTFVVARRVACAARVLRHRAR